MTPRWLVALEWAGFVGVVSLNWLAVPVHANGIDCSGRAGIDLARCERHQRMAAKCGPIKGEAHYTCDREFLLANPLDCTTQSANDARRCTAELSAMKACEPQAGREFLRCVRDASQANPMGAP